MPFWKAAGGGEECAVALDRALEIVRSCVMVPGVNHGIF